MTKTTALRALGVVVVFGLALFWIWAFSPLAPRGNKDTLSDRSFADPADARCKIAQDYLASLPEAKAAKTAVERADELVLANKSFRDMTADLRALVTGDENDRRVLDLWLTDWERYVTDREEYTAELRVNERASFGVTQRGGAQITRAIDSFANRNDMPNCTVPHDL